MSNETKEQKAEREAADAATAKQAAEDAAAAAAVTKAEATEELFPVRVLLAFGEHQPNDVVHLPAGELLSLKADGHVDDHPDAVDYARSLTVSD